MANYFVLLSFFVALVCCAMAEEQLQQNHQDSVEAAHNGGDQLRVKRWGYGYGMGYGGYGMMRRPWGMGYGMGMYGMYPGMMGMWGR